MKKAHLELNINLIESFKDELYKDFIKRFERELDVRIQEAFERNINVEDLRYQVQELRNAWLDSFKAKAGIFVNRKSKVDVKILKKMGNFEMTDKVCPSCNGFLSTDFSKKIFICSQCNDYWRELNSRKEREAPWE